jgi:hypothetical protein
MKFGWTVPIVSLLAAACGAPPGQDLAYNNYPILNGVADTSQAHMAVVAITDNTFMCSGTLIAANVVLTAGHCVSSRSMQVGFGNDVNWGSGMAWRSVTEKKVHPQYSASSTSIVNDIAMIKFTGSLPTGVVPIPHLPSSLRITTADIGTQLTYVGFGQTSVSDPNSAGTKMRMTNDLRWVCTSASGCGYPAGYNTICEDQTPSGICSGDSGGPAFIMRNSREYVAGVASYTGQDCASFGCSTKVDEYDENFIRDWVSGDPGAPCTSADQCDSGFCVDGVCCTSRCDGVCQACNLTANGTCTTVPNQTPCPDSDLCDGTETCQNGQCVEGTPLNCINSNVCTVDRCDPSAGCIHDPVPDGSACPNGNPCDGDETCQHGSCTMGAPRDCDDHNLCTEDTCDPQSGCRHSSLPDGTGCGGGLCGSAVCSGGECRLADPNLCDDQNPCTQDWCEPDTGCMSEPLPDGYDCGACRMCQDTVCVDIADCEDEGCGCGTKPASTSAAWLFLAISFLALGRKR